VRKRELALLLRVKELPTRSPNVRLRSGQGTGTKPRTLGSNVRDSSAHAAANPPARGAAGGLGGNTGGHRGGGSESLRGWKENGPGDNGDSGNSRSSVSPAKRRGAGGQEAHSQSS
jgi:hypothetical protein